MKHKKIVYICIVVILIIVLAVVAFCMIQSNHTKDNTPEENVQSNVSSESVGEIANPGEDMGIQTITLKSTSDNPIQKDNIEASNIEIINTLGDLKIITTLKNNSNEAVEGFFIVIDLLDENGEVVTTIAKNSNDKIEANGEFVLTNYASQPTDKKSIKSAKITSLEKNSMRTTIENSFEQMKEDAIQTVEE